MGTTLAKQVMAVRESIPHEPTISCPHCQHEIRLTESLAAPLLKSKELEFKRLEAELRERAAAIDQSVAERLSLERRKLAEDEQRKARLALGVELETKDREAKELKQLLDAK